MIKPDVNGNRKMNRCTVAKLTNKQLKKIRCLATDVDGVLTDGIIYMHSEGDWRRHFYIRDGIGLLEVQKNGIKTAFITSSLADDIKQRARNLKIDYFYDNAPDKGAAFEAFLKESQFKPDEVLYIGDDVIDLPIFKKCGISCAPKDAHHKVLKAANYVTKSSGGRGAVREVCDMLLLGRRA